MFVREERIFYHIVCEVCSDAVTSNAGGLDQGGEGGSCCMNDPATSPGRFYRRGFWLAKLRETCIPSNIVSSLLCAMVSSMDDLSLWSTSISLSRNGRVGRKSEPIGRRLFSNTLSSAVPRILLGPTRNIV